MEEKKKINFKDVIDQVDPSKLDLSEANIKRTIDYTKEYVLLKDLKPMYDDLEIIIENSDDFGDCTFTTGNINNLDEELKDFRVLSVHVYHDTATTSVIIKKEN